MNEKKSILFTIYVGTYALFKAIKRGVILLILEIFLNVF